MGWIGCAIQQVAQKAVIRTEISFLGKSVFGEVVFRAGFFIEHGPIPNGDAHE